MTRSATVRDNYAHVIDLFARIASLPDDAPERQQLRTQNTRNGSHRRGITCQ
ncbi:hypothetical protein [Rhodococcus sp. 24CO]|uniref:hypothetical protein n=1 Tax=Rhodococcus sp. 24CO TaxID=3117460 RepID=UPI003D326717